MQQVQVVTFQRQIKKRKYDDGSVPDTQCVLLPNFRKEFLGSSNNTTAFA
jgi:hypothetical protein